MSNTFHLQKCEILFVCLSCTYALFCLPFCLVLTIYSKLESHGSFNVGGVMTWTWVTGEQIWRQQGQRLRSLWKCLLHTSWWNLDRFTLSKHHDDLQPILHISLNTFYKWKRVIFMIFVWFEAVRCNSCFHKQRAAVSMSMSMSNVNLYSALS